jgi:hypothetical protein
LFFFCLSVFFYIKKNLFRLAVHIIRLPRQHSVPTRLRISRSTFHLYWNPGVCLIHFQTGGDCKWMWWLLFVWMHITRPNLWHRDISQSTIFMI